MGSLGPKGLSLCRKEQNPRSPPQKFINFLCISNSTRKHLCAEEKESLRCQLGGGLPLGMMRCIATDKKKIESL